MAELNTEAKLKKQLKQEKIQLWNPPYTDSHNQLGQQHMQVGSELSIQRNKVKLGFRVRIHSCRSGMLNTKKMCGHQIVKDLEKKVKVVQMQK